MTTYEAIKGACGFSNICRLDRETYEKKTGRTQSEVYRDLAELIENEKISIYQVHNINYINLKKS